MGAKAFTIEATIGKLEVEMEDMLFGSATRQR